MHSGMDVERSRSNSASQGPPLCSQLGLQGEHRGLNRLVSKQDAPSAADALPRAALKPAPTNLQELIPRVKECLCQL